MKFNTKQQWRKINKIKTDFLEKINKTDKPLDRRVNKITNTKNGRGAITTYVMKL